MKALSLLLTAGLVLGQQPLFPLFDRLEGKEADPCNYALGTRTDCDTRPATSVTVLLPSDGGVAPVTRTITLIGREFQRPATPITSTIGFLAVSGAGGNCAGSNPPAADRVTLTTAATATANPLIANTVYAAAIPFTIPATWTTVARELEAAPRRLCYSPDGLAWTYTGFKIGVVWNCNPAVTTQTCGARTANAPYNQLTAEQQAVRLAKTTCCIGTPAADAALGAIGQCVNPNVQTCCGSTAVDPNVERCCNPTRQVTAPLTGWCPCDVTNPMTNTQSNCPAGEQCCFARKYAELPLATIAGRVIGQCFNTNTHRCCDTGVRYDPGSQQCCVINGVQSINTPCPCGSDSDCTGGQFPTAQRSKTGMCCRQNLPVPLEARSVGRITPRQCTIYNNYPTGTGLAEQQPCLGACFDSRIHTCCNGAVCRTEFESCCNSTCCNKFAGKCALAYRAGKPGNRFNPNEFTTLLPQGYTSYNAINAPGTNFLPYEQCTLIEQLSPVKSFWIFVLPAMLILASLVLLALTLTFASKVSSHAYHPIELALMGLAVLIALFGIPTFFATVYKYGVVMVLVASFTILVAAARSKGLNVILVIVYLIALVYLFDPFHGNAFFTLASARFQSQAVNPSTDPAAQLFNPPQLQVGGAPNHDSSGILHATGYMYRDIPNAKAIRYCTNYYQYFSLDQELRDPDRWDNTEIPAFGYCSRGWVFALLIIEGFLLIFTLVNFIVAIIALILRFKEDQGFDPIELEVRGQVEY